MRGSIERRQRRWIGSPRSLIGAVVMISNGILACGCTGPSDTSNGLGASGSGAASGVDSVSYTSITDNEWTVVALLRTDAEPSTSDGPFLVLQQGVIPVPLPVEKPGHPESPCADVVRPRDRTAVHLPAERVVYLGVTFPGMDPGTLVKPTMLGRPATVLVRAAPLTVRLTGMALDGRYTVPTTGPGAAILFALRPPDGVPSDTYRFEIDGPAIDGRRFVYACVGS